MNSYNHGQFSPKKIHCYKFISQIRYSLDQVNANSCDALQFSFVVNNIYYAQIPAIHNVLI